MKSTGIVRKVDDLGRIVLPKELRKILNIDEHDQLEIFVDGNSIILQKYEFSCIFCGNSDDIIIFKGKHVCSDCINSLT
jgi:looped-hinge helix DNA binding domain, AbrB family